MNASGSPYLHHFLRHHKVAHSPSPPPPVPRALPSPFATKNACRLPAYNLCSGSRPPIGAPYARSPSHEYSTRSSLPRTTRFTRMSLSRNAAGGTRRGLGRRLRQRAAPRPRHLGAAGGETRARERVGVPRLLTAGRDPSSGPWCTEGAWWRRPPKRKRGTSRDLTTKLLPYDAVMGSIRWSTTSLVCSRPKKFVILNERGQRGQGTALCYHGRRWYLHVVTGRARCTM